jgi:transcriptional regulator with XRE-family HTH domain
MSSLQLVFGKNVRKYRKQLNFTQAQLSELLDISPSFVGYIENGKTYPSFRTIELLSIALQVPPGKLFEDNGDLLTSEHADAYNPGVAQVVQDLAQIIEKYSKYTEIPKTKKKPRNGK